MKKIIGTLLLAISMVSGYSQGNEFVVSWQIAAPGKEIKRMIDKTSFQGWSFEYRRSVTDRISVGGNISWNIFHEEVERSTWEFPEIAVTSRNWRYTHVVPLSATFQYNPYKNTGKDFQWYIGGGLGGSYVNQEIWAGMYSFRFEKWSFHAYPEVGLRYVMSDQTALLFSAQYMYLPQGSNTGNDLTYLNFRVGLSFGKHRVEQ